ncbi:hypothetical protein K439DRAFT_1627001 [Ramaria rubella]|nr:hypothetical protein K439DRAFT_1627001 [Ramaria rubella]
MFLVGWPIWSLVRTVFGSILEVGLLCVAGYILAQKGILDKKTQKHINRLNVALFTPSLLFSKVAFSLTPEKLKELWIIPIVFVVTTVCSMFVAYSFGSAMRLKRSQRSFAMAASMFMNSNSLPIALMQSLVYTVKDLAWGDDDDGDAMLGRALTYLVLYSTLGMILRWSYGVHLLTQADENEPPLLAEPQQPTETSPLIQPASTHTPLYSSNQSRGAPALVLEHTYNSSGSSSSDPSPNQPYSPGNLAHSSTLMPIHAGSHLTSHITPRFFTSFPNTPVYPRSEVSSAGSDTSDEEGNQDLPSVNTSHKRSLYIRVWHRLRVLLRKFNAFMTVPMWAALASIVVACAPHLQHTLEQHGQPIKSALNAAGNCSIPLTLVVLGAYFYVPQSDAEVEAEVEAQTAQKLLKTSRSDSSLVQSVRKIFVLQRGRITGAAKRHAGISESIDSMKDVTKPGETRTVMVAVLSRMVLTPLVLLPLLAWLLISSDVGDVYDDPVFALSNVLLITSAPALTLAQITQAASGDAFERLISRTIFWAYCIVTPLSTIVSVVIGLLLAKL